MSAVFDRFMVANNIGTNRKLRRLPVAQRWIYVAGVLALASQSPIRGALLITDGELVTPEDLAEEATVKVSEAKAALESFRRLGMLDRDEHGVEWVHDWDTLNPSPKPSDSPEATRARKREQRARDKAARGGVTSRGCHAMSRLEEEGEVEEQQSCSPNHVGSGADAARTSPLSITDERQALADHVVGVLERGIDSLTTDEPCKRPTRAAVLAVLGSSSKVAAIAAATEARSIAQSQNRAPNIVALFAAKLKDQSKALEAA